MSVPCKPFQNSKVFVEKAGAYPSDAQIQGRLLALAKNERQGWKGFPGANTLAYYENYYEKQSDRQIDRQTDKQADR